MNDYESLVKAGGGLPFDPYDDPRPSAKTKIIVPAIAMLIIGILVFLGSLYSAFDAGRLKSAISESKVRIQRMEGMPPDQKKFLIDSLKWYEKSLPVLNGVSALLGAAIAIGGYQMMTLSARVYCLAMCCLSMIPFATSCCCCLGMIFGTWGIFALLMPDVKAAFAMTAYLANQPKSQ